MFALSNNSQNIFLTNSGSTHSSCHIAAKPVSPIVLLAIRTFNFVNQTILIIMKKNMILFAFALIFAGLTTSADAREKDPQTSLHFAGYKNNQPVYKLEIKNTRNEKLMVTIRDQEGNILHQEVVSGMQVSRNYRFADEQYRDNELFVEVSRYEDPLISRIKVTPRGSK